MIKVINSFLFDILLILNSKLFQQHKPLHAAVATGIKPVETTAISRTLRPPLGRGRKAKRTTLLIISINNLLVNPFSYYSYTLISIFTDNYNSLAFNRYSIIIKSAQFQIIMPC